MRIRRELVLEWIYSAVAVNLFGKERNKNLGGSYMSNYDCPYYNSGAFAGSCKATPSGKCYHDEESYTTCTWYEILKNMSSVFE